MARDKAAAAGDKVVAAAGGRGTKRSAVATIPEKEAAIGAEDVDDLAKQVVCMPQ